MNYEYAFEYIRQGTDLYAVIVRLHEAGWEYVTATQAFPMTAGGILPVPDGWLLWFRKQP